MAQGDWTYGSRTGGESTRWQQGGNPEYRQGQQQPGQWQGGGYEGGYYPGGGYPGGGYPTGGYPGGGYSGAGYQGGYQPGGYGGFQEGGEFQGGGGFQGGGDWEQMRNLGRGYGGTYGGGMGAGGGQQGFQGGYGGQGYQGGFGGQGYGPRGYGQAGPEGQQRYGFGPQPYGWPGGYGGQGQGMQGYGAQDYGGQGFAGQGFAGQGFAGQGFGSQEYGWQGQEQPGTTGYSGMSQSPAYVYGYVLTTYTGRGPKGYRRSDDRIREDISDDLTRHPEIDPSEIEIQVQDGEVTLTGTVESRQAKRLAEDVVEQCAGVQEVHNRLRVQRSEAPQTSQVTSGQQGGEASRSRGGRSGGSSS